jgi:hypothetical protein
MMQSLSRLCASDLGNEMLSVKNHGRSQQGKDTQKSATGGRLTQKGILCIEQWTPFGIQKCGRTLYVSEI